MVWLGIGLSGLALLLALSIESALGAVVPMAMSAVALGSLALVQSLFLRRAVLKRLIAAVAMVAIGVALYQQYGRISCTDTGFANGAVRLSGTVCSPRFAEAAPAVLFVHGSGRVTRHENLFFARFLSRRGFTTLAYDKRGAGESSGDTYDTDYSGYADDAAAGIAALRQRSDVDSDRIFVMGFSEAEWVAMQLPEKAGPLRGMVLVGASGLSPLQQVNEEMALRLARAGHAEDDVQRAIHSNERYHAYLRGKLDAATVEDELRQVSSEPWFSDAQDLHAEVYPREEFAWWRGVMDFEPAPFWRDLDVPVLLLKGADDQHSDARKSVERITQMVAAGGDMADLDVRVFPDADHMLLVWPLGKQVPPPAFAEGYLQGVNDWLREQSQVGEIPSRSLPARAVLTVQSGVGADGRPTPEWLSAVSVFNNQVALDALAGAQKLWSEEELAWARLIEERLATWTTLQSELLMPFGAIETPDTVAIVLGNQGGQDAFVPGDSVIGFDLSRLLAIYGAAAAPGNSDRIDRFFAHEYTHIAHNAWRRHKGLQLATPLKQALWACLTEGLGNYRSLSSRWRDDQRRLTPHAVGTLQRLQPEFTARIAALAHASDSEADALMQGLSTGPFEQKWGALTVALWLARETQQDGDTALRYWVEQGPGGVLELALKYLPAEQAARLPSTPPI